MMFCDELPLKKWLCNILHSYVLFNKQRVQFFGCYTWYVHFSQLFFVDPWKVEFLCPWRSMVSGISWRKKHHMIHGCSLQNMIYWLLVWNMNFIFHFIYGMSSFPLTFIFLKMVISHFSKPPTSSGCSCWCSISTRWCPPSYKLVYNPINYRYISTISPSYHLNLQIPCGFSLRKNHPASTSDDRMERSGDSVIPWWIPQTHRWNPKHQKRWAMELGL